MVERQIDYVNPEASSWTKDDKTFYFAEAILDDGSSASAMCFSKGQADQTIEVLKGLVGKDVELELEANGEYQGKKKFKLKNFPGKPSGGNSGGGRSGGGMSHAQAGYMAAASALSTTFAAQNIDVPEVMAGMIVELGELLTEALFSRRKGAEEEKAPGTAGDEGPKSSVPTAAAPPPADAITLAQMKRLKELGAENVLADLGVTRLGDFNKVEADEAIEYLSGSQS